MNKRKLLINVAVLGVMVCFVAVIVYRLIQFAPVLIELSQIKLYPENTPARTAISTNGFSPVWSNETEDGNQHIVYMQLFSLDEHLIYASENSLSALDYFTGDLRWSIKIPESSTFYLYNDKLYSLGVYDADVPFAPEVKINTPSDCNSSDLSTMHVYDPHNGQKIWEYSYRMAASHRGISFKNNSAFIQGLTIAVTDKYSSELEIELVTGKVVGVSCRNLNDYTYSTEGRTEGIMSSGFWPVYDDLGWKLSDGQPTFIVEGTKLIKVNRENRQPMGLIEFSGSDLNPYDVQMIIQNDLLVVYLDDSNQFFVFQMQ